MNEPSYQTGNETAVAEELVLREDADGIATLTLNRPKQRNALSRALMAALHERLDAVGQDPAIKVVIIAANGPAFCAGHDLKEIRAARGGGDKPDEAVFRALFEQCSQLMLAIQNLRQPVIARVEGMATAAGCQLVASCDLAVAGRSTHFATPGVNIGLFCSTPMVAVSRVMPRKQTMEMLLTGDPITAETAFAYGLINRIADDADVAAEAMALARKIADKSPYVLAIGKQAFYEQLEHGVVEAYAYTAEVMTRNMLARDAEEGIGAFVEKRPPVWQGQ